MSGRRSFGNNKKKKSSRRLDFNGPSTFESDSKRKRRDHRNDFVEFHEDFLNRNEREMHQSKLPQPQFYANDSQFSTPLKTEEKYETLSNIPDGVFFIKGKTGVELFRQMLATSTETSKSMFETPDAPKKK